jgi:hypothetical protein
VNVTGKTVGGTALYKDNRLDRMEALRLWTAGSAWFSSEQGKKGALVPGQLADLAVLSADYLSVREADMPEWSPVAKFGGYAAPLAMSGCACAVF